MPEPIFMWSVAISKIGTWLTFVALIFGMLIFKKSGYGVRSMVVLCGVSFLCDMIITFGNTQLIGTIVIRTYSFIEFILVSLFFLSLAKRNWFQKLIVVIMILFPVIVIGDAILSQTKNLRDDPVTVSESIVFVFYSVITLYLMMKDMEYKSITATGEFWLISGLLLYFGGAIFVFSSSNYASSVSIKAFDAVWTIHAILTIIYKPTITIGFWKARKQLQ